jgi:hypothetical protein
VRGQPSPGLQLKLALLVLGLSWVAGELAGEPRIAFYAPFTFAALVLALRVLAALRGRSRHP